MLNLSEVELDNLVRNNLNIRVNQKYSQRKKGAPSTRAESSPKASKYHNQKVEIDGITFDSKKEARRYQELKAMKLSGQIIGFDLQPEFLLLEGFKKNGETFRPMYYRADFKVLYPDGHWEVEDTKGVRTKEFNLKRKLFEHRYRELSLKII
jgi:hypothetical protein